MWPAKLTELLCPHTAHCLAQKTEIEPCLVHLWSDNLGSIVQQSLNIASGLKACSKQDCMALLAIVLPAPAQGLAYDRYPVNAGGKGRQA